MLRCVLGFVVCVWGSVWLDFPDLTCAEGLHVWVPVLPTCGPGGLLIWLPFVWWFTISCLLDAIAVRLGLFRVPMAKNGKFFSLSQTSLTGCRKIFSLDTNKPSIFTVIHTNQRNYRCLLRLPRQSWGSNGGGVWPSLFYEPLNLRPLHSDWGWKSRKTKFVPQQFPNWQVWSD
jgi:hypothetical protein